VESLLYRHNNNRTINQYSAKGFWMQHHSWPISNSSNSQQTSLHLLIYNSQVETATICLHCSNSWT